MTSRSSIAASLLLVLAVAGCAQSGPPVSEPPPVPVDTAAAVRAIRAAGEGIDSAVQVQPLRDAAIEGYLKTARAAESALEFDKAIDAAEHALKLAPDAPDLLQYRAELDTARGQWSEAEQLVLKSFALGPKLGSLCARNWQTVVEARTALNDAATAAQAQLRLKECRVAPRLRM
jgi:tetratricopeptide (TPR) repeat protein